MTNIQTFKQRDMRKDQCLNEHVQKSVARNYPDRLLGLRQNIPKMENYEPGRHRALQTDFDGPDWKMSCHSVH